MINHLVKNKGQTKISSRAGSKPAGPEAALFAASFFDGFGLGFALYAQRSDRPGLKPFEAYLRTAGFADAELAGLDSLQSFVYFKQQKALALAQAQYEITVRLNGSPIGGIGIVVGLVVHIRNRVVGILQYFAASFQKQFFEMS
jgi:hypothetical protein